jgi:hypothetical protein
MPFDMQNVVRIVEHIIYVTLESIFFWALAKRFIFYINVLKNFGAVELYKLSKSVDLIILHRILDKTK